MSSNQRHFIGNLLVRIGQYDTHSRYLLVANTRERAEALLDVTASEFYGDGSGQKEDGGYYANGGEVFVRAQGVHEIGLSEFESLRTYFPVRFDDNVARQRTASVCTAEGFKAFAKSAANVLQARGVHVSHSDVLEAMSSGLGCKNWQVLAAKFSAAEHSNQLLWIVSGRRYGDDDDTVKVLWAADEEEAVHRFKRHICAQSDLPEMYAIEDDLERPIFVCGTILLGRLAGGRFTLESIFLERRDEPELPSQEEPIDPSEMDLHELEATLRDEYERHEDHYHTWWHDGDSFDKMVRMFAKDERYRLHGVAARFLELS